MGVYSPEFMWPRLVPANAVMVSIFAGTEQAFGLLANVSASGACVASGVHFQPGSKVLVRIGFDRDGVPFSTEAKVVWSRDESQSNREPTFYHGIHFTNVSDEKRSELMAILSGPNFNAPIIPGRPLMEGGLDAMLVDLNEDLDRLASKLEQDT